MLYTLLVLLALWLAICAYRTLGTVVHGRALADDLRGLWAGRDGEGRFALADVARARAQTGYLGRDLTGLYHWASPPACFLGRVAPALGVGRYGQYACDGLGLASGLVSTAEGSLREMQRAMEQPTPSTEDPLQSVLSYLASERGQLLLLLPAAQRASLNADAVRLPEKARLPGALAPGLVNSLLLAPEILGGDQSRVYAVILQNTDELRPTGGFIGSVVAVTLQGARMTSLQYLSSYDVERPGAQMPDAPGPLAEYMSAPGLVFRDANWSPDFPTSAAVLGALYSGARGPLDGIVAVDTVLLTRILYAIGPVPVPRYGVTVTGDNLVEISETYWENPLEGAPLSGRAVDLQGWLEHRKDFGGDFMDAGRAHLATQDVNVWARLGETLLNGIAERHLQFWSLSSPAAQEDLRRAGWSGEMRSELADYLMVVDANVGFNKVDRRIERGYAYHLAPGAAGPLVTVTLSYTNTATVKLDGCVHEAQVLESYEALTQQCYWDYVRILVPLGAELVETHGSTSPVDQGVEAGRASFGTMIVVPPGKTSALTFAYRLPKETIVCDAVVCAHRLTVQKQAGTVAVPFVLTTDVDLLRYEVSGEGVGRGPVRALETVLQVDREIVLYWQSPSD